MFSGGALGRMTIFALTILPYISASIIMQLMTSISPQMAQLKKDGESGRKTINQYTTIFNSSSCYCSSIWLCSGFGRHIGISWFNSY